jgi:Rhs element Vgr protein
MNNDKNASEMARDLVSFDIRCNNVVLNKAYRIISLEISLVVNKIATAVIYLIDGDAATQNFSISGNDDSLIPGNNIEISLGYHAKNKPVFSGVIVKQSLKSGQSGKSVLVIEAKHKCFKLALGRNSRSFLDMTDADIIMELAKRANFPLEGVKVSGTNVKHSEMLQYNATDWDFIVSRAEMNGMLVFNEADQLIVTTPDTNQDAALEIIYGVNVLEIDIEMDGRTQVREVHSHAWNADEQVLIDVERSSVAFKEGGSIPSTQLAEALGINNYKLFHSGDLQTMELEAWADAILLKSRMAKIRGTAKIKGDLSVRPGQLVKLSGFGKRMNGNAYVTGIRHSYSTSIWETNIQFGLTQACFFQQEDIIEKPAAGLLPGVTGLQIGRVTQLEQDPDRQDRIRIQLPQIDQHEGLWARVACVDAGKDRGVYFRPEINDEVLIGFINNDPRHAVVLGMLNSAANPAPFLARDNNHEKGFVTRSNIRLIFNDEHKSLSITTPKGKMITVDDEADSIEMSDQNRNVIRFDNKGITIESAKDIMFKTTNGDFKVEAINIKAEAEAKFSGKGNASAELQSAGQTVVKGSIVSIN